MYAQTNYQLYKQIIDLNYPDETLEVIFKAYELAKELSAGLYRPSGKTHVSHLIGTASVLASLNVQIEIVAAGLLHSIYTHGEFGDGEYKIKDFKREYIRNALDSNIEKYIAGYTELKWGRKEIISDINENLDDYSTDKKNVVLMRLADTLDEFTDFGNLYGTNPAGRIKYFEATVPIIVEISDKLGYSDLGAEIKTALDQHKSTEVSILLINKIKTNRTYLIPPMHCRKKLNVALSQAGKDLKIKIKKATKKLSKRLCTAKKRISLN